MKIAVFSSKRYDRQFFETANSNYNHELHFFEPRLNDDTVQLANGFPCICAFVNDQLQPAVLRQLHRNGTRVIALRCAGFNNVDLVTANELQLKVVRVPAYSPHSVAEHTVALMLSLNRKIHRAYSRVREGNFTLDGLLGFDFHGRTVGIVGTGKIGAIVAQIMKGFGCELIGYDVRPNPECVELGMTYVTMQELLHRSDIISLHCPLVPESRYLINAEAIQKMKPGMMLINTSRGAVIDTQAVVQGLKSGVIGALGIDVYEEEADYFFENMSEQFIADDILARLLTFPNVLVTGHQAFFTHEAMTAIAETTLRNVHEIETTGRCNNEIGIPK